MESIHQLFTPVLFLWFVKMSDIKKGLFKVSIWNICSSHPKSITGHLNHVPVCVCPQICPRRVCIHHCSCQLWAVSRTGLCLCVGSSTVSCCLVFRAFTPARWQHGMSKTWANLPTDQLIVHFLSLALLLVHLKPDVFVLQVFRFVQNLIGCEEQARVFKEEVRPPSVC